MPRTPNYWQAGVDHLKKIDPSLKAIIEKYPNSILTSRMDCFHTLMRSIVGQQISVQSADAVWRRLEGIMPKITPVSCAILTSDQLRECGLSRQKIAYIGNLIEFHETGKLDINTLKNMEDEELIKHVTQIKGIGKWSAEMFAIFCLMRSNILPLDDIGLQRAICEQYSIKAKPFDKSAALEIAYKWQPYSTIATWFLWRSIDPNEVNY